MAERSAPYRDRLFISYRREDSAGLTGRLYDRLVRRYGDRQVFMDVTSIDPGSDFTESIQRAVRSSSVMLAMIGPRWASIADARRRPRLHDKADLVRIELEVALEQGIRIVPVLVDGADMPRGAELPSSLAGLVLLQAVKLSHAAFARECGELLSVIDRQMRRSANPDRGGPRSPGNVQRRGAASPAELFGRDRELATLREAWRSAVDGRPMLVVVSGPPGGGKTALLDAAAALGGEGGVVAVCCQPENGLQLQPMVELVRSILAIWPPEEFDRADEDGMTLLARLLPEFVSATSAHNGDDPDFAVARRADAAEWVFTRAAKLRPLVVIVDDAQWSDNFTLNVLRRLAGSGPGVPLLVIAAARSEYLTPSGQEVNRVAEWYESLTAAMRLELGSLDRASVRSWVASVLPEQLMFRTDALTALALERTGGEPLFVAEMMRALARAVKDLRSFSLADERAMTTLNVRSSFDRRFRKLTNQAQHAVKAAAVIGPVVDLHLLGRVLGDDEDKLVELLDEAVAEGLVVEVAGRLDTYAFQHELLRDFLVQQLGRNRRAHLHQRVAIALSAAADEGSDRDIALHALLALPLGDVEEVVGLAMKAAERLLKSNAVDEAARMYNRALTATEGQLGPVQRCELLIRLGETQAWSGEPSAAGTTLHAAIDLARELGDGELFARSVLATGNHHRVVNAAGRRLELLQEAYEGLDRRWSGLRVTVAANLLGEAVVPGRSHPVDVEPAVLLAAARAVGEPEPLADALFAVHSSRKAEASVEARHALARELLGLGRAASKTRMVLGGLTCSIYDEVASGRLKAAWTSASELGARASDVGSVRFQWRSLVVRSGLARTQGRADEADQLSRKAHQLGSGYDVADADAVFVMQLHEAYWHGGRLDELRPRFDEAAKRSKLAIAPLLAGQANLAAGGARSAEEIVRRAMPRVLEAARDELWLPTVALAAEVCTSLSLGGFDEPLMKMLLPYSGQWVPVGVPVGTWGPVDRYLGRLALMSGATGEARSFLRHAELQCHEGSSEVWARHVAEDLRSLVPRRRSPRGIS